MRDIKYNSLVEEDDVREPDVLGGHVEHVHAAVLVGVPAQLVVDPLLQFASTIQGLCT